ncbi:sensor histidine kinase [Neobacillus sp. SM06]|uniref:sensor histidine kinase n=1 Tax=Neobacillus sp. SM06 TaxID=3422492 RepID=UPI003D2A8253
MGTPVFFFFLLWSRKIRPIAAGILTGVTVVFFRVLLDRIHVSSFHFQDSFHSNYPVFFYYLVFAAFFSFFKINKLYERPFIIGLLGIVMETMANFAEILIRHFTNQMQISASTFPIIGGVAIIRSFFVLGFFNILILRETKLAKEQEQKRSEQILQLISNLYVEMFQLKKSSKNAEALTSTCYSLYRDLKQINVTEHAQTALKIAGELHEIKKDNQRIYAGLSKLLVKEKLADFMSIEEILSVIVHANKNYGEMLGKTIDYHVTISGDHPRYHTFILFSILNNFVANSVDAIDEKGKIVLSIKRASAFVQINVKDNGCGIPPKNFQYLFNPGFTTKFDQNGMASNGIGLSYIKNVIENSGGEIHLVHSTEAEGTMFEILLPVASLTEMG